MAHQQTAQSRHEFDQWQGKEPGADWVKGKRRGRVWIPIVAILLLAIGWAVLSNMRDAARQQAPQGTTVPQGR